jgi:hypothetical protein
MEGRKEGRKRKEICERSERTIMRPC